MFCLCVRVNYTENRGKHGARQKSGGIVRKVLTDVLVRLYKETNSGKASRLAHGPETARLAASKMLG
ncbi:hypothetical protein BH24ACT22_BH24ACT22_18500 [soil metagenome]